MADVNQGDRPLSPHLTIYSRQINMMTSIFHRITGCGLALTFLLGVWWFIGLAGGPEKFRSVDDLLTGWIGGLVFLVSMIALWYHFFTGVRHLVYDAGYGFEPEKIRPSSYAVFAGTALMSVITLIVAF